MFCRNRLAALLAAVLVAAAALAAHDTWLVPTQFRAMPGQPVQVALNTSEDFPRSEAAPAPERIARFEVVTADGSAAVTGYRVEGESLVADVAPGPGVTLVAAVTHGRLIVLEAPVFTEYITEEGLEQIVAARVARGESDKAGRELYSKVAKLALCADGQGADFRQPLGLHVEIVPETNPCGLRVGDTLRVQVLFEGRPLAHVQVGAGYAGMHGHHYPVWVKTDAEGRAALPLDRAGAWFVRSLHMIPSTDFPDADWQSWFSTFTFGVEPQLLPGTDKRPGGRVLVTRVVVEQKDDGLTLDVQGSGPLNYVTAVLTKPLRLVIDLPQSILISQQRHIRVSSQAVVGVRMSQFQAEPPISRLIVDLREDLREMIPYEINSTPNGLRVTLQFAAAPALSSAPAAPTRPATPAGPEVVVLEPSESEVAAEKITVRGIAIDASGIARVQVAGRTAAMQPRSKQAMEFWLENVPLQLGENELQIVATNVAGGEVKTTVEVRRVAGEAKAEILPLTAEQVMKLLEADVTPVRLATIVQERGVNFALAPALEARLRALGATDALLLEIAKAKK